MKIKRDNITTYYYFIFKLILNRFHKPFNGLQAKPCSVHHGDSEAGINYFVDGAEQHCG
jgi:hypothetical protein